MNINTQEQMLALLRGGLWGTPTDERAFVGKKVSWKDIFYLAKEQTVLGLVGDGLALLPTACQPPQKAWMNFVMMAAQMEEQNKRMNDLVGLLARKGCPFVLLKGQELALCYRNPLRRAPGDIDMFMGFDKESYEQGKAMVTAMAEKTGTPNDKRRHADFVVNGNVVEVHGNMRFCVSKACDSVFVDWMKKKVDGKKFRQVTIGGEQVNVLPADVDVLFVFVHLLNHLMQGGVGLRQVSDWMMALHAHRVVMDKELLKEDIRLLHLEKFWRPMAAMAVEQLGFPKEEMPLYDKKFSKKGERIMEHIFMTGNFGTRQKQNQIDDSHGRWIKKLVTFWGQIPLYWHTFWLYPKETLHCFTHYVKQSI